MRNLIPLWAKKEYMLRIILLQTVLCILAWGTRSATNCNRLIILQKKILRLFGNYGKPQDLLTEPPFSKYGLLKVNQIYYFKLSQIIHKKKIFAILLENTTNYPLRHWIKWPPKIHTNYGRQTTSFQVAKILNNTEGLIDLGKISAKGGKTLRQERALYVLSPLSLH